MYGLIILFISLIITITFGQNGDGPLHIDSIRVEKCRSFAILNPPGEDVGLPKVYPHVAQIAYEQNNYTLWRCQGSLISSIYILTAAQCLTNHFYGSPTKVRLGVLSSIPIERSINKLHVHPNYTHHSLHDDIGLIEMSEQVIFNEYVRPICLPDTDITPNLYYRLNYRFQRTESDFIPTLEWHQLELIDNDQCIAYFRSMFSADKIAKGFPDKQMCLRERNFVDGACSGYSGAPLLVPHPQMQFANIQIGITMYGRRCNYRNPEGYTRVYKYVEWVENLVWSLGDEQ